VILLDGRDELLRAVLPPGRLLIHTRNRTVLAEGFCSVHPADAEDSPTYDQLTANDAALVKARLRALTAFCAEDYPTRILGLY
jgi:hypothetical protein